MDKIISIVIADDQRLFIQGFIQLFSDQNEIIIAGEASNGAELIDLVEEVNPDVVIADIQMPVMDGIQATLILNKKYPKLGIIALSMYQEDHYIVDMLEAGARGYLSKNTTLKDLTDAIKSVYSGGFYFCNTTSPKLSRLIASSKLKAFTPHEEGIFSEKELEIIYLICNEYSSKQIGPLMKLSQRTVENYRNKILEKISAKNVAGLVIYAFKHGLHERVANGKG